MDTWLVLRFILFFVLLFFSALFSAAEVALFSLSPVQVEMLKEKHGSRGKIISTLLASPRKLLVTIYIGNELINVAIAAVATLIAIHYFGPSGIVAAIGLGTFLLLLFGEITPKTFAFRHAKEYALIVAKPLLYFSKLIYPFQIVITGATNWLLKLTGSSSSDDQNHITEDEMKTALKIGEDKGVIKSDEKEMIFNVFELGDTTVTEIMTARAEMFSLPVEEGSETIARRAALSNFSRIPVYKNDSDNIVGILYTKDLLDPVIDERNGSGILEKNIREPYFIPPTKKINELLREFRKKRIHIAIVVDEYGGVEGLVTLEDILEEVLGEETEPISKQDVNEIEPGIFHVDASLPLVDFNRLFKANFEVKEVDTVGGLVFHLFGRLPQKNEKVCSDNFEFTVMKLKGAKIKQLMVHIEKYEKQKEEMENS